MSANKRPISVRACLRSYNGLFNVSMKPWSHSNDLEWLSLCSLWQWFWCFLCDFAA